MKILIFALSGIGDALMFTPSIKLLRESYPDAQIDALCMFGGVRDIYKRNENLNNILYYNFMKEGAAKSLLYLLKLRGQYDLSINVYPANRKEYNLFSFLVGAKKRAAVDYLRMNGSNLSFLNNIRIKENDKLHNVEENLLLCKKITGKELNERPSLEFPLISEDIDAAKIFFSESRIAESDIVIGFHPGCATLKNHIKRRWEPEKFIELGRKLIKEYGAKVLIFGGPEESQLKNEVKTGIASDSAYVVETKDLAKSAAIMKRCNLFITNDSSLMHVASALRLNVIAIIGPTNTNYIHPWNTEHRIVSLNLECAPCFFYSPRPLICHREDVKFKCIKELSVEMVLKTAASFLKEIKNVS
ncbi:MAG: glycosyltransferase family 9 protein [Bacteroidota bacterium]|nr:glycosyltransferase family 9 protein [Bacteroidota bacterium]MDP4195311.1 glycosyltransferase family 9 protein [Bacteroidota bacterium]